MLVVAGLVAESALAGGVELASLPPASIQEAAHRGDYRALAAAGVDTLLEVTLTEVSTAGQGINRPLQLYLQAHVRLIRTRDGAE